MDYFIESAPIEKLQCDCIVAGIYLDGQLTPAASALDSMTHGLVKKIIARGDLSGKNGETVLINAVPEGSIERVLLVGLGKKDTLSAKIYRKALSSAVNGLKKSVVKSAVCCLSEADVKGADLTWKTRQIVEVFNDTVYQFTQLKADKETNFKLQRIAITAPSHPQRPRAQRDAGLPFPVDGHTSMLHGRSPGHI